MRHALTLLLLFPQRPLLLKGHERSITFLMYNREGDLLFTCSKDSHPTVWFADNGERLGTYEGHTGTVYHCDVSRTAITPKAAVAEEALSAFSSVLVSARTPSHQLYLYALCVLCACTADSKFLLTASADQDVRLWNVETGDSLFAWKHTGYVCALQGCDSAKYPRVSLTTRSTPPCLLITMTRAARCVSFNKGCTRFLSVSDPFSQKPASLSIHSFDRNPANCACAATALTPSATVPGV